VGVETRSPARERGGNPPMCHKDTLGVVEGSVEGGEVKKPAQRVILTRWASMGPVLRAERRGNPPTCHKDTLGVVEGSVEGGGVKKPAQRVILTRWASMSRWEGREGGVVGHRADVGGREVRKAPNVS
jgi:hypothetical protein